MNITDQNPSMDDADGVAFTGTFDVRRLSQSQLAQLGVSQIAYVRPVVVNGTTAFAIHAADGTPMAVAPAEAVAMAAIRQHDMMAVPVH